MHRVKSFYSVCRFAANYCTDLKRIKKNSVLLCLQRYLGEKKIREMDI